VLDGFTAIGAPANETEGKVVLSKRETSASTLFVRHSIQPNRVVIWNIVGVHTII